jgi:hypothetical protein
VRTIHYATRIARKAHHCVYCGAAIHPGQQHAVWTNVDGGEMYTGRGHPECVAWGNDDPWYDDEMMDPYDFREMVESNAPGPYPWPARLDAEREQPSAGP